jgi:hypothetical protein
MMTLVGRQEAGAAHRKENTAMESDGGPAEMTCGLCGGSADVIYHESVERRIPLCYSCFFKWNIIESKERSLAWGLPWEADTALLLLLKEDEDVR